MTLKKILDETAKKLAEKASDKATSLQESIDAFKALTAYYAAQGKRGKKSTDDSDEDEPGGFNFASSSEVVNGSGQHTKVRTRRDS